MPLLPDAEAFRRLVDGTARGVVPATARAALTALAAPYGLAVACRNAAFDRGLLASHRGPVPVVSVGNLTLGGTGKTPLVAWLVRELAARGRRPAVVSRGYGAARGEQSDEAAELALLLPAIPHVANRDRVAAVAAAAAAGADAVVLDDGFQHRRLARDLDIVAIDATDPWGGGRLFPRGLLREPVTGLRRAHAIVLTRAAAVSAARRDEIRRQCFRARGAAAAPVWLEAAHRPRHLRSFGGATRTLEAVAGRRIAAFSGIGNPSAFRGTLAALGAEIVGFRSFPDHHPYPAADLDALAGWAAGLEAEFVLTTLKDLVKVRREALADIPVFAVEIAFEMLPECDGLPALGLLLDTVVPRPAAGGAA